MRKISAGQRGVNRRGFVGLNGRENIHGVIPETGIDRTDLRALACHFALDVREKLENDRLTILKEIRMNGADTDLHRGRGGHFEAEQGGGEQRTVRDLTKEPAESIE